MVLQCNKIVSQMIINEDDSIVAKMRQDKFQRGLLIQRKVLPP